MVIFVVTYPDEFEYGVYSKKYFVNYENAKKFANEHGHYPITTISTAD